MSDRRTAVTDAALAVVGQAGLKGLTHRAVDRAAGLPQGSAANLFGTRSALITGVLEAMERADRSEIERLIDVVPTTVADLADLLANYLAACLQPPARDVARARLALGLDHPDHVRPGHERFLASLRDVLVGLPVKPGECQVPTAGPERHEECERLARRCVALFDGLLLHHLTVRDGEALDRAAAARTFAGLLLDAPQP